MVPGSDRVVRALTDDGSFRVITLRATDTVQAVIDAQKANTQNAARCGELVTGAVLIRETMAPDLRVQAIFQGAAGTGSLVADSHPNGLTRGLISMRSGASQVAIGDDARLQVVRTMPRGQIQQGVVEVGEQAGIAGALTSYMHGSEQVLSVVGVACVVENRAVKAAGGYIVQLLPEAKRSVLGVMTERLEQIRPLSESIRADGGDPDRMLEELLAGLPYTRVNESPIHFGCTCSLERVVGALATLGLDDIRQLIAEEQLLDVGCDYCGRRFHIRPAQLRGLLAQS
jgi:molecular chaperone Hsp33